LKLESARLPKLKYPQSISFKSTLNELSRLNLLKLLQETEHFCRWRQQKVAKIVPYGPPRYDEGRWN